MFSLTVWFFAEPGQKSGSHRWFFSWKGKTEIRGVACRTCIATFPLRFSSFRNKVKHNGLKGSLMPGQAAEDAGSPEDRWVRGHSLHPCEPPVSIKKRGLDDGTGGTHWALCNIVSLPLLREKISLHWRHITEVIEDVSCSCLAKAVNLTAGILLPELCEWKLRWCRGSEWWWSRSVE